MSIPVSIDPLGTLGASPRLESCLFAQAYVVTDVTSAINERYDFDISYVDGLGGSNVLDVFGYVDGNSRRMFRKYGNIPGLWHVFYGANGSIELRTNSNDATGTLRYEEGLMTVYIGGRTASHSFSDHSPAAIRIGLRTSDLGRFRFRRLKVTQGSALVGDFVPWLIDDEVCIKNLVTGAVLHAAAGTLQP